MTHAQNPCFDVVAVLAADFRLVPRSPTLHGDAPLKAVQGCPPFLQGNGYGFAVWNDGGFGIVREGDELRAVYPQDPEKRSRYRARIAELKSVQLLANQAAWSELLAQGPVWRREGAGEQPRICLWTGLLVRPHPGFILRVTEPYNRRNPSVVIDESVIADDSCFTPLVLEVGLTPGACEAVLAHELACLGPLKAGGSIRVAKLGVEHHEVGARVNEFYDPEYFVGKVEKAQRAGAPPPHRYKRLIARADRAPDASDDVRATMLTLTDVPYELRRLGDATRFDRSAPALEIKASCSLNIEHNGHQFAAALEGWESQAKRIRSRWARLYGKESVSAIASLFLAYYTGQGRNQERFALLPPFLADTDPAHGVLLEGIDSPDFTGLRGFIWSDVFHVMLFVFKMNCLIGTKQIRAGQPIGRVIPLPKDLLQASFRSLSLEQAAGLAMNPRTAA